MARNSGFPDRACLAFALAMVEVKMTKQLKQLNLCALGETATDPVVIRRRSLESKLRDQRELALDPSYLRKTYVWKRGEDGIKHRLEVPKPVRPWWIEEQSGSLKLLVRYGARPIEFEKGKQAVLLKSKDDLLPTIELIIQAVRAGELDDQINAIAGVRSRRRRASTKGSN